MKAVGAAGATAAVANSAGAATDSVVIDDDLSTATGRPQEAFVVFEDQMSVDRIDTLDVEWYRVYESFPVVFTALTGDQILEVAEWDSVLRVRDHYEVRLENDDSQEDTNARAVWESEDLGYTGENVHVGIIDSGVDGTHPGMENMEANYRAVDEPAQDPPGEWVDVGNTNIDEFGHGTHCIGSLAGTGDGSVQGDFTGMAPDTSFTSYEAFDEIYLTTGLAAGTVGVDELWVGVARILGAYDDILQKHRNDEQEFHIISNSWGAGPGTYDPYDPIAVAMWEAFEEGILTVFSAGNDGEDEDTLGILKHAPFVLSVGAAEADGSIADFSSRGKFGGNYDRQSALDVLRNKQFNPDSELEDFDDFQLERPGIVAKGSTVMSAQSPDSIIYGLGAAPTPIPIPPDEDYLGDIPEHAQENLGEPLYATASGTSMACPTAAGCIALFIDAYIEEHGEAPDPIDTINTIEATAREQFHPDPEEAMSDVSEQYTVINAGAGYVDARAAVERAVEGDLADFDEVELAADRPVPTDDEEDDESEEDDADDDDDECGHDAIETAPDDCGGHDVTVPGADD